MMTKPIDNYETAIEVVRDRLLHAAAVEDLAELVAVQEELLKLIREAMTLFEDRGGGYAIH